MTQIFDEKGNVVPVTVIEGRSLHRSCRKTVENDGYAAVQIGFGEVSVKPTVTKPPEGAFRQGGRGARRCASSVFDNCDAFNVGDIMKADTFAGGDRVDVIGISKGKGYAGAIKRWNFQRLKETHGSGPVAPSCGFAGRLSTPSACPRA